MNLTQEIDKLLIAHAPACNECLAELMALPIDPVEVRTKALAATSYYEPVRGKCALCGNWRMICMPTGPKGQKRPADVIDNAVRVMRIATGEEETPRDDKNAAAKELGAKGGKKRAANLSPERRAEIARKAAAKRWEKS
jgi:hypothetical protein